MAMHPNTIRATARRTLNAPQYIHTQEDAHLVATRLEDHHRVRAEVMTSQEWDELMGVRFHSEGFVVRVNG